MNNTLKPCEKCLPIIQHYKNQLAASARQADQCHEHCDTVATENATLEAKLVREHEDVVTLSLIRTKLETYNAVLTDQLAASEARVREMEKPELARNQPCGCVICICDGEIRCYGCGAKNCGKHQPGEIPNPVYKPCPLEARLVREHEDVVTLSLIRIKLETHNTELTDKLAAMEKERDKYKRQYQ